MTRCENTDNQSVILVSICSSEFMKVPPLGILYVGDALQKAGYDVRIEHFTPDEIERKVEEIASGRPLLVGLSAFTSNQTRFGAKFSRLLKQKSDIPVVWGGVHASMNPEQTLSEDYVDIVVLGEGEETIVDLAAAIKGKKELADVRSIGFERDGEAVFTEARPLIKDLDAYRLNWELIDMEKYLVPAWGRKRVINFVTSRGCPYRCGFCYNVRFNRGRWRSHSRQFVISEIQNLKEQYGVDGIRFYDDNFLANKKRAFEILEAVDLPWEGQIRIGYISEEVAEKLARSKCQGICFGFESGSNRILELVGKDQTVEDIELGTRIMAKHPDIRVSACFILANPTETQDEVRQTIKLCLRLQKMHPKMGFSLGAFLPFPGVPLYELLIEKGFVPPSTTEGWEEINRMNDEMELSWLPWVTERERKDFVQAARYARLLPLAYVKIPLINKIPGWRLSHYNFRFPVELGVIEWLHDKYADEGSPLSRLMRKMVTVTHLRGQHQAG